MKPATWNGRPLLPVKCMGTIGGSRLARQQRDRAAPGRIRHATGTHVEMRDLAGRKDRSARPRLRASALPRASRARCVARVRRPCTSIGSSIGASSRNAHRSSFAKTLRSGRTRQQRNRDQSVKRAKGMIGDEDHAAACAARHRARWHRSRAHRKFFRAAAANCGGRAGSGQCATQPYERTDAGDLSRQRAIQRGRWAPNCHSTAAADTSIYASAAGCDTTEHQGPQSPKQLLRLSADYYREISVLRLRDEAAQRLTARDCARRTSDRCPPAPRPVRSWAPSPGPGCARPRAVCAACHRACWCRTADRRQAGHFAQQPGQLRDAHVFARSDVDRLFRRSSSPSR